MPVETLLGTVKEFVIRFSDIISNTIDADVIIADNNFKIVGNTSRYYTVYDEVDADSLIAEVVKSRKKLIVEDKAGRASCLKCLHFDECKLFGFVGVPIFHNDIIAGAIALILPQHRVNSLFENIDSSVEFLENMAELLSGKIDAINENKSLNQIIIEQEAMMDLLSDAVVFTDFFGNIRHYNKLFQNLFLVTQDCIGKQLQEFIPHAIFEESYENQKEFKNIRIHFAWGNVEFYGFISSKYVRINGKDYGTMFSFRTVNEVLRNAQLSEKGSLVTFNWSEWMFPREILKQAKSLAITHNNILILGRNRNLNEILAKGITNYSERSLKGLKLLYCDNLYRDLLEVFLFDEFGELRDSNMGTMLVQDVENLPLHIQKRFLHFLKTGKIGLNNDTSAESDVRFIFATTKNLKDYVDKGLFMEELYYRIAEYSIEVSGIQEDQALFYNMLRTGLYYYATVYDKHNIKLDDKAKEFLYQCNIKEDLNLLEATIETIVRRCDGVVSEQDLMDMELYQDNEASLSRLEKERISELLQSGISKTEIAKRLGIGRATLYRKLMEYELSE